MLLKNANKETHVLNTRKVSLSRRRRKRPPLRVAREVIELKEFQGEKFKIFKFTFVNCARWDLSLLF